VIWFSSRSWAQSWWPGRFSAAAGELRENEVRPGGTDPDQLRSVPPFSPPNSARPVVKLRPPLLIGTLTAAAAVIHLLPTAFSTALQFERTALDAGEWWRLFTAHVTHFGSNHFIWDAAVFLAFGTVCEFASRWRTALTLGVASIAISFAVWLWQPQFAIYRGLSGLDSALFGMFAADLLRRKDPISRILGVVGTFAVVTKCMFESATGSTAFASGDGYVPVPLAHVVGFLTGFVMGWTSAFARRVQETLPHRRPRISAVSLNPSRGRRRLPSPSPQASPSTP
jgi:rhomboid family GlyGly-CTERM serine protease